ncbi:MAG: hypothetical protein IIA63_12645, partial [Nitrospinae bacterium]|nr:hypothetical protein [Nitrospinota bacterium]
MGLSSIKLKRGKIMADSIDTYKPGHRRSPSYPAFGLEEAIKRAKKLYEEDGRASIPAEAAVKHLGYGSQSGPATRCLSALKQFELLSGKKGRVSLTQLALDLTIFKADDERFIRAVQAVVLKPIIYKDLYDRYGGEIPSDETLKADSLPLYYTTYSSCFRREAGSYGKDTKGILRVHQFDKQEMVIITKPENSWKEFDHLIKIQEKIIKGLKLPYHLLTICTGDLPKPSAKVVDLECWMPAEQKYRETHSASNCTDYQARRNKIRFKNEDGKIEFVHILNATAITPRTLTISTAKSNDCNGIDEDNPGNSTGVSEQGMGHGAHSGCATIIGPYDPTPSSDVQRMQVFAVQRVEAVEDAPIPFTIDGGHIVPGVQFAAKA